MLTGISKTQTTVATSSGEAELYALTTGCGEGLAVQDILEELGVVLRLGLCPDSSTAKRVAQRRGPGAMKHLETKYLFVQQLVHEKRLTVFKVPTKENPADIGTKWHGSGRMVELRSLLRMQLPADELKSSVHSVADCGQLTLTSSTTECQATSSRNKLCGKTSTQRYRIVRYSRRS